MRLNIFNSLIGLCVATAFVSCSDALVNDIDNFPVGGEASDMISFVVAGQNNTTRGGSFGNRPCGGAYLRTSNGADSLYLNMAVGDFSDPATRAEDISDTNKPSKLFMTCRRRDGSNPNFNYYFENTLFARDGDRWKSETPYYWLGFDTTWFRFFGYYAENETDVEFIKGTDENEFVPSIKYTVPTDTDKQFDLSYYVSPEAEVASNRNALVSVPMNHALARIAIKTGTLPEGGELTNVKITNLYNSGVLDLGNGKWTPQGELTTKEMKADGTAYMVLPTDEKNLATSTDQESFLKLTYTTEKGEEKSYSTSLKDVKWEAGKQYSYTINIKPEYQIEIVDVPNVVDAHYVIAKATIKVPVEKPDLDWNLSVLAKDETGKEINVDATIISAENATYMSYYEQGYWLDKVANNGIISNVSARGEAIESGTGKQQLYIFIPENVSDANRTIVIKEKTTGQEWSITQRHPAWAASDNNFGWEQIDDNEFAQWGFYSNEKQVYVYNHSYNNLWQSNILTSIEEQIKDLIKQYDAGDYVQYKQYTQVIGQYRYWVSIDYSGFSNLGTKAMSNDNGLQNTTELNSFAGTAYSRSFENALDELTRIDGKDAYRKRKSDDPSAVPDSINDKIITKPMLPYILKKNRYNLNKFSSGEGDVQATTTAPIIKSTDIVWYLPASDEFNKLPNSVDTPINRAECWSSTAVNNSTDAYTGAPTTLGRKESKKIRVCRKRTN